MSDFATEHIRRSGAKPVVTTKLELTGGDTYYSNVGYRGATWYPERIVNITGLRRAIDLMRSQIISSQATITLRNNDGKIGDMFNDNVLKGRYGEVQLGFKSDDTLYTETVAKGLLEPRAETMGGDMVGNMILRPAARKSLEIFQREVNATSFANAPSSSIGQGQNIVQGDIDSTTRANGAVYCPIVDTTNKKISVAQHVCILADNFIKVKSDVVTNITPTAVTYNDLDDEDNEYTSATLGTPGDWDTEAKYYCDVQGWPDSEQTYCTMDGVNDYGELVAADSANFPSRAGYTTGSWTVELKVRPTAAGTFQFYTGVFDQATGNYKSWAIFRHSNNQLRIILSEDGNNAIEFYTDTVLIDNTAIDYVCRVCFSVPTVDASSVDFWINGTKCTTSVSGTHVHELWESTIDFNLGRLAALAAGMVSGRVYYMILAEGLSEITGSAQSYRDDGGGIQNIIAEWQLSSAYTTGGTTYSDDLQHSYPMTLISMTDGGNFTRSTYVQYNPAHSMRDIVARYSGLDHDDIYEDGFNAIADTLATRGYDTAAEWGGIIPWQSGALVADPFLIWEQWGVNTDCALYMRRDGRLSIKSLDVSELAATVSDSLTIGDLGEDGFNLEQPNYSIVNSVRARYGLAHRLAGHEAYRLAVDEGSVDAYGESAEQVINYNFIRGTDTLEDVASRYLLRRAGNTLYGNFTIPGHYKFSAFDIGDNIAMTINDIRGGMDAKQFKVIEIEDDIMRARQPVSVASVGDVYGPVAFTGETTIALTSALDTYVSGVTGTTGNSYGSVTPILHGGNPTDEPISGIYYRNCYKFDLSGIVAAGGTVKSASLTLYADDYTNPSQLQLRELTSSGWNESSTFAAFDGGGWSEGNIGGTQLAPYLGGGTGIKNFILNAAGLAYLNAQIGAAGDAYFTHQAMNRWETIKIASREDSNSDRQPTLTIVYT